MVKMAGKLDDYDEQIQYHQRMVESLKMKKAEVIAVLWQRFGLTVSTSDSKAASTTNNY